LGLVTVRAGIERDLPPLQCPRQPHQSPVTGRRQADFTGLQPCHGLGTRKLMRERPIRLRECAWQPLTAKAHEPAG